MKQLPYRWKVLTVVSVAVFMSSLDLFIVNIAFPDIARDFHGAGLAGLSWILNAYAIVFASLLVALGRSADRLGRRRSFLAGVALFTLASALCAVAPSVPLLVAARVVQAVGAAAVFPVSLALILVEFPPAERRGAVAAWAAVGGVAAAAGPPVGGLLVQAGWQLVFLVNVPIGLGLLVVASRVLRETREPAGTPRPDVPGALMLTVAIGALTLGIVKAPDWGWGSVRVVALLAGAAVVTAAFARRSARHPVPVIEPDLVRRRSFAFANLAGLLFFMAFGAMLLSAVLFLTGVWHESILRAGLQIAPGPATAAVFAVPAGRLAVRYGERLVGAAGSLLFAVGAVYWLARVGARPDYPGSVLPGLAIGGAGVGLVIPSLFSAATSSLPPERFATGTAVTSMSRQIGIALGVAILVAILGTPDAGDAVARFKDGWTLQLVSALGAAAAFAAIGAVRVGSATEDAPDAPAAGEPVPAEARVPA
jgi:EmrB/QacA subfamily drug resistance transporter